jgi:ribosomal protein S18 acetylase RimI-like enzyme
LTTGIGEHAELELDAIRWAEAAVRSRFADLDDDLPRVIRSFAEADAVDQIRRYESLGYVVARHFVDMERSLTVAIPAPALADGVDIVPWNDRWKRSAYAAQVAAFVDHWGSLPPTWEKWQHGLQWPGHRLDLSHLAIADGEVVALALNGVYPQDWGLRNRSEGWIETLGTRQEWRKRGLASALLSASFQSFVAEGLDYACIGVDGASPTGALRLYENLGFSEYHRSVSVMKAVSPAE